jgi:voltage-dependent potassium channel beta subunit
MIYRTLGRSGLKVSALSLGSWMTFGQSVDLETTEQIMTAAYDAGINYFDGAEAYGRGAAEEAMGHVFKKTGWARDTYVLSGKVIRIGEKPTQVGLCRKRLNEACDAALQRMNTDHLDLFFCHRPDKDTPLEEIVVTMNQLIDRGKIFYWGTSEFSQADLMEMWAIARENRMIGPLMEQTGYNMLGRDRMENQLVPLFDKYGMGSTVYSALRGGILTGKYNDGVPEDSRIGRTDQDWLKKQLNENVLNQCRELAKVADDLGITMAEMALAWVLKNENVSTAILGATKVKHVEMNIKAIEQLDKLTDDVMERIDKIIKGDEGK